MGQCGSDVEDEAVQNQLSNNQNANKDKTQMNGNNHNDDAKIDQNQFRQPGVCNLNLTYNLLTDLKELKKQYPEFQDLFPRKFINVAKRDITDAENNKNTFTIMQFNMLADGLSGAYTIKETEKTFTGVDKACLEFTYRILRIVEELTRFDPDIITLEECDTLKFIMNYLTPMDYSCEYQEKSSSPVQEVIDEIAEERKGDRLNMPNDGVAVIYKKRNLKSLDL